MEYVELHCQYLFPSISVISKVYEILHCWRVYFFVLGGNEERGYTDQLHLALLYIEDREVAIDKIDGQIQSFG